MVLMIDNYDSFTYNLVQYIEILGMPVRVVRNDVVTAEELDPETYTHVVISPGPGTPGDAGISMKVIERFAGKVPLLGVCLGHQAIAEVFGGKVVHARRLMHGKTSMIFHDGSFPFSRLPNPFRATRYHSLIVDPASLPPELKTTAWSEEDEVMAICHRNLQVYGVQFHPESILTEGGMKILADFLGVADAEPVLLAAGGGVR
ncbi:anthranilate synthase component II [Kyrpidia tusciae]|uniref:Glutamine amidotransferase of anthranilate synthase n=1 Tax=Kyrpidia tusciae (strain DSM 2912 / NBRC 15312 / T2) TaxID=562970 RepID=D5WQK2_KYRT2|nr:aminodeoxychorismate/anthranilate synthase component II [Kyrpidia tusciae]ADG06611.1 glutamine amidotransferase of anthranilate synthase [Kyrpidia tusciae DSM 2912]